MKNINAKFVGQDGSIEFKKEECYNLQLKEISRREGGGIRITTTSSNKQLSCDYQSIISFLENWTEIKTR